MPRRRATIPANLLLGAPPYPVAAALISLALYSWTATPWMPQVTIAAPRACPSLRADEGFFARKTFSTAASVGRWRRIRSESSRWILKRRPGKDGSPSSRMTPHATGVTAFPRTSTIPYPVRNEPGSIPRMRLSRTPPYPRRRCRSSPRRSGRRRLLEGVHHLEHRFGGLPQEMDRGLGTMATSAVEIFTPFSRGPSSRPRRRPARIGPRIRAIRDHCRRRRRRGRGRAPSASLRRRTP